MSSSTDARPMEIEVHGLRLELAGISEQGPRSENQDAFSLDSFPTTGLVAVADGMGGQKSGRIAADVALRALLSSEPIRSLDDARRAVRQANGEVTREAERDPAGRGGMGCALGFLALTNDRGDGPGWIGAHVGDVRILSRSPDGTVRLETRDHTPAFARWEAGEISLDEIPDTAGANRLQRAVGHGGEADALWLPARPGWSWLLVSDGVYKTMRLDELGAAMGGSDAAAACESIRRKVQERGPEDNYTAVLIRALADTPLPLPTDERTDPMPSATPPSTPRRSASGRSLVPLLVALLALLASGAALWTALETRTRETERRELERQEMQRLRIEVDSLRAQIRTLSDPFGPVATPPVDTSVPVQPSATPIRP